MIRLELKMSSKKNTKRKKILRFSFSLVVLFSITSVIVTPLYLHKLSHDDEKDSFTTTERSENSPEIKLSSTSASMIVNSTDSMSATSRSSTTTASSSTQESTTKITLNTTTSTRTSSVRTTTTASYTRDTSITSSTITAPVTTTSESTPPTTTKALETLPEFQCETNTLELKFDDCLKFCKNVNDKPLQIATTEQAKFMLDYGTVKCPDQKIWMGYRTNNGTHYWIDDDLQLTRPVPPEHKSALASIGCNYFDHQEDTRVPYFKVSKEDNVDCKEHKLEGHTHYCLCMSQLPQEFPK